MGDIEITVHNDEPEPESEPEPEPISQPIVVPVPVPGSPMGDIGLQDISDLRAEVASLGGRLDSIQAFIERIELAESIDGNSDEEALDTLAELADMEEVEEHEPPEEAGETPQADGTPNQQDGATPVGENSGDERPRATHPWWRTIRN